MIIGVDIGGTKTYVATFTDDGELLQEARFTTNSNYDDFLQELSTHLKVLDITKARAVCAAVPGLIDRQNGIVKHLGNLPWQNKPIRDDIARLVGVKTACIENDSKLAGLAEARFLQAKYQRVVYLTLSTGIGAAYVVDGHLVPELLDMEIGKVPLQYNGQLTPWEDFASGRAFFEHYGQRAIDVEDDATWQEFAGNVAVGLGVVCAVFQAQAVVFGGGLGQRLNRFKKHLLPYLTQLHPVIQPPEALLPSHFRGQSVIYGCYEYAKELLA